MVNGMAGATCAEVIRVRPEEVAAAPDGLSMEEAAALPLVGQTALQALRDLLRVREGQRVLINGASGGVGTVAVQLAAAMGARVIAAASDQPGRQQAGAHRFDKRPCYNRLRGQPLYSLISNSMSQQHSPAWMVARRDAGTTASHT